MKGRSGVERRKAGIEGEDEDETRGGRRCRSG